ncbi:MAG: hypothetical protein KC496_14405, partial [Anaerolineae bacterium]|nr:hypothetical protein [Anaerolineae bacterium]
MLDTLLRLIAFPAGLLVVSYVLTSAVRSFVLPRGDNVWLTRVTFGVVLWFFRLRTRKASTYEQRDRIMALFAPLTLLVLPVVWLVLVLAGYTLMFWAAGIHDFYTAFSTSGSSLLTLGFAPVNSLSTTIL